MVEALGRSLLTGWLAGWPADENLLQGYSHSHKVSRTICNWDQNEIKGSRCCLVLNQVIKECFKEAIKKLRRVTLQQNKHLNGFFDKISSNQGPFIECLQEIKVNFRQSKILIPAANGSTGLMKVTTPGIRFQNF